MIIRNSSLLVICSDAITSIKVFIISHFEEHLSILSLWGSIELVLLFIHIPKNDILKLFYEDSNWMIRLIKIDSHL